MKRGFIKVSYTVPKDLEANFRKMAEKIQKHVIRQAIRSAIVPLRTALSAHVMALNTPQTSGATERALTHKVGQSKSDPNRFYGIVGVNKLYREYISPHETSELPPYNIRQVSLGVMMRRKNGVGVYSKKWQPKEVVSKLRRRFGVTPNTPYNPHRIRRPSAYWHLVLYGFGPNFKRGKMAGKTRKPFAGYGWLEKVIAAKQSESRRIFIDRFRQLMLKEFPR
jgi:hypothetical protein